MPYETDNRVYDNRIDKKAIERGQATSDGETFSRSLSDRVRVVSQS